MLGGNLEVIIDLLSFKNIDLYDQGYYALKVNLIANETEIIYPYLLIQDKFKQQSEALLFDSNFFSKIFEINYSDQYIEIDSSCVFRLCYNSYPDRNLPITVKVTLLYAQQLDNMSDSENSLALMQEISQFEFILRNCHEAQQQGIEVIFDQMHFCNVKLFVYTIVVDYKYNGQGTFQEFLRNVTKQFDSELVNQFIQDYVDSLCGVQMKYKNLLIQMTNQLTQSEKSQYIGQLMKIPIVQTSKFKTQIQFDSIAEDALQTINQLGQSLFQIWFLFQQLIKSSRPYLMDLICNKIQSNEKKLAAEFTIQQLITTNSFGAFPDPQQIRQRETQWNQFKKNKSDFKFTIQDSIYLKPNQVPVLFEDILILQQEQQQQQKQQQQQQKQQTRHLIVLVHGYQGTSLDMQLWRNLLHLKFPYHIIIQSSVNEFDTEIDIKSMSQNLANEIKKAIIEKVPSKQTIKLSFIGHSLGGVLIRGALAYLQQYSQQFNTYISLGSPHAGLNVQQSAIIETGLWIMKQFKKKDDRTCLDQMTLSDHHDLSNTLVSKFSEAAGLSNFSNIVLAYSLQDQYIPHLSACLTKMQNPSSRRETLHNEMVENILGSVTCSKLTKVAVYFPLQKANLDKVIGRAAHIEFIDNPQFIRLFIDYYYEYLQ